MDEVNGGIDFDWDAENARHLKRHRVTSGRFEEVMTGDPVYLEYKAGNEEERYKVLGATKAGRIPVAVWTPREGKVRAVTAYDAGGVYQQLYLEGRG